MCFNSHFRSNAIVTIIMICTRKNICPHMDAHCMNIKGRDIISALDLKRKEVELILNEAESMRNELK